MAAVAAVAAVVVVVAVVVAVTFSAPFATSASVGCQLAQIAYSLGQRCTKRHNTLLIRCQVALLLSMYVHLNCQLLCKCVRVC